MRGVGIFGIFGIFGIDNNRASVTLVLTTVRNKEGPHYNYYPLPIIPSSLYFLLPNNMRLSSWMLAFALGKRHSITRARRVKHSRYRKDFLKTLSDYERMIRQRRIPRVSLCHQQSSAWRKLFLSNNDQAFIMLTGFDVPSFHHLLQKISPVFEEWTPHTDITITKLTTKKGRRRAI